MGAGLGTCKTQLSASAFILPSPTTLRGVGRGEEGLHRALQTPFQLLDRNSSHVTAVQLFSNLGEEYFLLSRAWVQRQKIYSLIWDLIGA